MLGNKCLEKVDFHFTHVHADGKFQSHTQRSSRKIQICNLRNGVLLTFCHKLFVLRSTLHGAVYTKSVRESEEIGCTSLQSSKSSFRKIRIFEFAYSALALFYSLFRFKNHHCIELYIRKVSKNRKRLVAHRYSLRRARFAKYGFLNLHILHLRCFILCLGLKIITALSCIYEKCQRIGRDWLHIVTVFEDLVSQNTDFRICIFAFLFLD